MAENYFTECSGIHNPLKRMEAEPQNTKTGFRKASFRDGSGCLKSSTDGTNADCSVEAKAGGQRQKRSTWLNSKIFIVLKQSKLPGP